MVREKKMTIAYYNFKYPNLMRLNSSGYNFKKTLREKINAYLNLTLYGKDEDSFLKLYPEVSIYKLRRLLNDINEISRFLKDLYDNLIVVNFNFHSLLENDFFFKQYFKWLKKYTFLFLFINGIEHLHIECSYELDREDIDVRNIEVKLILPFENFNDVLDFMELFLRDQEQIIIEDISSFSNVKEFLKNFKKTNFIFRSLYESS